MALRNYIYALMTDRRQGPLAGAMKFILWLASRDYFMAVWVLRRLYAWKILPSYRVPRPVISVGNITLGGTGKTPLVIAVVKALAAHQLRPAILTRGYMPKEGASDEARMLAEHLPGIPVLVGRDRRKSIEEGLKHHAIDVFVCDDAFQHWPLQRDLDIVTVDAADPFGNGFLLPRGILREPPDGLKRAHIIVLTRTDNPKARVEELRKRLSEINPQALIVQSRHACAGCVDVYQKTAFDLAHLKGVSVVAFCAIADPESFRRSLQEAGLNAANVFVFMDHHAYTPEDMAMVRKYAQENNIQMVVTTHKDAVKIQPFREFWEGYKVYYLQVELEITHGKNVFIDRIVAAVRH